MMGQLWFQAALLATAGLYTAWGTWVGNAGFCLALAAAIALSSLTFRSVLTITIPRWLYCIGGAIALVGLLVPPCRVPSLLILAAIIISFLPRRLSLARAVALGVLLTGLMFQAQNATLFAYSPFEARWHAWPGARAFAAQILRLVGIPTGLNSQAISIQGTERILHIDVNPEVLGLRFLLAFTACGLVLIFLFKRKKRVQGFLHLLLAELGYILLRFIYMIYLYIETSSLEIFWHPGWTFASFLPLIVILTRVIPLEKPSARLEFGISRGPRRFIFIPYALIFAAVCSLVIAFLFVDPGQEKHGRILIDEGHSDWEWTTIPIDTVTFGEKSVYNYFCMKRLIDHFYDVDTTAQTLGIELLSRYDVLIVKTPTRHFLREEVDAIEAFVQNGGGLLLISDHTDVFGMTTFINPIAARFGLFFRRDATFDIHSGGASVFQSSMALPHPIIHNVPPLIFETSCTINAPLMSQDIIIGRGLGTIGPDYSTDNFLPKELWFPEPHFGAFLQLVTLPFGRGRVVGFTDSSIFSCFSLFMPGRSELLLNMLAWLNRRNAYEWLRLVLLGIASVAALLMILLVWQRSSLITIPGVVLAVAASLTAGWLTAEIISRVSYPPVPPRTPYTKVCFEVSHSPNVEAAFTTYLKEEEYYTTFYVWTQRVNLVPAIKSGLTACEGTDLIVIIEPSRTFTKGDIEWLARYLAGGGHVLVLDDPRNIASTAESLLTRFGLSITYHPVYKATVRRVDNSEAICHVASDRTIVGGDPWIVTDSGDTVASAVTVGHGRLVAIVQSSIFTDAYMGTVKSLPDEDQLRISSLEFWLLNKVLGRVEGNEVEGGTNQSYKPSNVPDQSLR